MFKIGFKNHKNSILVFLETPITTNQLQETLALDCFSLRRTLADIIMIIFDVTNGYA